MKTKRYRLFVRRRLQIAWMRFLDARDILMKKRRPMTPSRVNVAAIGGGDFAVVGKHLADLLIRAGRLQPHERVLDVACGIGRVAVPLTNYLTNGEYCGFDVSVPAIEWCRREISFRHPNFSFIHVDVFNSHYNWRGKIIPTNFVFPCATESVDVAFLGSILTHLTPLAAARYVAEVSRVLKIGGRGVMTFFLLDDRVREECRQGRLAPAFNTFPEPWYAVQDRDDPEAAVAYDTRIVEDALRAQQFEIVNVSRGSWSGHPESMTYQDLIVVRKISP